jgi:hypothetical protein
MLIWRKLKVKYSYFRSLAKTGKRLINQYSEVSAMFVYICLFGW